MRFTNAKQVVAIALVWAAMLYAADFALRPRAVAATTTSSPIVLTAPAGFRVEVSGAPHYRLEATVAKVPQRPIALHFRWLDSAAISGNKVVAYVRYNETANVTEFADALAQQGFGPTAIRLFSGPELNSRRRS